MWRIYLHSVETRRFYSNESEKTEIYHLLKKFVKSNCSMENVDETDFIVKRVIRFDRIVSVKPKRIFSVHKAKAKIDCNMKIFS